MSPHTPPPRDPLKQEDVNAPRWNSSIIHATEQETQARVVIYAKAVCGRLAFPGAALHRLQNQKLPRLESSGHEESSWDQPSPGGWLDHKVKGTGGRRGGRNKEK